MAELNLYSPLSALSGIGPSFEKKFQKLGIYNLYDLIALFPRAYEDRSRFVPICELEVDKPACFQATVISYPRTAHIRKGLSITKVQVSDMTARLTLVFFNQPYVEDKLKYGADFVFYGTLRDGYGTQMQNPTFESAEEFGKKTGRIYPVYPLTAGIGNNLLNRCMKQALDACLDSIPDILPFSIREEYHLLDAKQAYKSIHAPESWEALADAKRRLIFDEFFAFSAGLSILRSKRNAHKVLPWKELDTKRYEGTLPYKLTTAQNRAISDIIHDLSSGIPMNRLIQGDVGSGKTAIAACAAYLANQNGKQTAFIAPTELLAEQHFASLGGIMRQLGVKIALLTGSTAATEKRRIRNELESGEISLIIGTHALLSEGTKFSHLGLVITDEQHRFGVSQRAALAEKGQHPHALFLSATPIPRTLGLVLYGDLDVTVLDELPSGRKPVETYLVGERLRERTHQFIRKQVAAGNQVYIVCPAVDENEETELKSAEQWASHLQTNVFPDLNIGLVHGRMKSAEKEAVMRRFSTNEIQILVATTVIEVGVDIPNATLMIIEEADRFGLSQMHQLRGRVGRGSAQSYCILVSDSQKKETRERLKALCATNDGFKIAEDDLRLRGPGDILGNRQHGLPQFKVASLDVDLDTLQEAQHASRSIKWSQAQIDPAYKPLIERIEHLFQNEKISLN